MTLMVHGRAFAHIAAFHPELTAFRRDLHAHPELGFEEVYTAARVKQALELCRVDEIHTGIGKTGLVAVIKGQRNNSAKMIGLRADMDALPMTEHNDFAWKSAQPGLMHGCGHDGHTAMGLGIAERLLSSLGPTSRPVHLLMDRAYEGNETRQLALDLGFVPVVPPMKTRVEPWEYDREMYKRRNEVERLFRRLKGYRRIFSRFEKLDVMFIAFISFALIADGLRLC